jgi:hypothetical protein
MHPNTKSLLKAGLVLGAALGLAPAARAQFQTDVGARGNLPGYQTQAVVNSTTAPRTPTIVNNVTPGGGGAGFNPYMGGYFPTYYGRTGGALMGSAALTSAQGQFLNDVQQSSLTYEQVRSARMDNRRKQFDEMRYEQANTPTTEDIRQANIEAQVRRSRFDPPPTEIWAGKSLNDVMLGINRAQTATGLQGPAVPLDQNLLLNINFTDGTTVGSAGALRAGTPEWPFALNGERFSAERKKIDQLLGDAVKQLTVQGRVDAGTFNGLRDSLNALRAKVRASLDEMSPDDYMAANRFVSQLQDNVKSLNDPNAKRMFSNSWLASVNTVGDLMSQMNGQGLRFAPATSGGEAAYNALYRAMISYDAGLNRMVATHQ